MKKIILTRASQNLKKHITDQGITDLEKKKHNTEQGITELKKKHKTGQGIIELKQNIILIRTAQNLKNHIA